MTAKRDLKRRVRQRQARTGESYVTARRRVLAARPGAGAPTNDEPTGGLAPAAPGAASAAAAPDVTTASPDAAAPGTDPGDPGATGAAETDAVDPPSAGGAEPAVAAADDPADEPAGAASRTTAEAGDADEFAAAMRRIRQDALASSTVAVVELVDVSEEARRIGLVCRVAMFPALVRRAEPASVLSRLRDLLVETTGDPQTLLLAQVALTGYAQRRPPRQPPNFETVRRFIRRARAGLGGISEDGSALAFHVAGRDGIVPVLCSLSWSGAALELAAIDDLTAEPWNHVAPRLAAMRSLGPMLFVIHDGRWYPVTQDEFLIGRKGQGVHLAIKGDMVSRHHAAVIRRNGAYYLKDLGSTHGIFYKGMQIDGKRIDDGDVFQIGEHELRFTFQPERPDD